jgi:hypothetical protein
MVYLHMNTAELLTRALDFDFLTQEEGVFLYHNAATADLAYVANELRKIQVPSGKVTWQIDRNVNTTNVCIANCKFCNFFRRPGHEDSYITDIETYKVKIEETFRLGGDQLLLQGGHHPDLGLEFYASLFKQLKELYPVSYRSIECFEGRWNGFSSWCRGGDFERPGEETHFQRQVRRTGMAGCNARSAPVRHHNVCNDDVRTCGND